MYKSHFCLSIALSLASFGCALEQELDEFAESEQAIAGGTPITPAQTNRFLPVRVQTNNGVCSGTLLYNDLVVTNEHCVPQGSTATFSSATLNGVTISGGTVIPHPSNIPSSYGADVLMVRTNSSFSVDGANTGFRRKIWRGIPSTLVGKNLTLVGAGPSQPFEVNTFEVTRVEHFTANGNTVVRAWIKPQGCTANPCSYQVEGGDSGSGVFLTENGQDYLVGVATGNGFTSSPESEVIILSAASVGSFVDPYVNDSTETVGCTGGKNVYPGDFNGDGRGDLLCHDPSTGARHRKYSETTGFSASWTSWSSNAWCNHAGSRVFVGDFNGDGRDDLLCSDTSGRKWVDLGPTFAGTESASWEWLNANWCHTFDLRVGDFDGDGSDDLLCHDPNTGRLWLDYANDGFAGTDSSYNNSWCVGNVTTRVGRFNSDARTDLACQTLSSGVKIQYAGSGGTFGSTSSVTNSNWCPNSLLGEVTDFDGDGLDDLVCRSAGNVLINYAKNGFTGLNHDWGQSRNWCTHSGAKWLPAISLDANVARNEATEFLCHDSAGVLYQEYH